jgi:hypothetical protein
MTYAFDGRLGTVVQRIFNRYSTMRQDMLDETVRFLSWALKHPGDFPRIPRVRVDSGLRFSERIKVAFWTSVLDRMAHAAYPSEG